MAGNEVEDCNVVHEQPTRGLRGAFDQVLHFWPLLAVMGMLLLAVASTLGQVYVSNIAKQTYEEIRLSDPAVLSIKTDIGGIKSDVKALKDINGVAVSNMANRLNTIETRLDTLIRIQLEGSQ